MHRHPYQEWQILPRRRRKAACDQPPFPSEWGKLLVRRVEEGEWFWALMEEVYDESTATPVKRDRGGCSQSMHGFWWSRDDLADAFRDGRLYGVQVEVTRNMEIVDHEPQIGRELLCRGYHNQKWYWLPAFMILERGIQATVDRIWTRPTLRRRGLATLLIRSLNVQFCTGLCGSGMGADKFFESLGIEETEECETPVLHNHPFRLCHCIDSIQCHLDRRPRQRQKCGTLRPECGPLRLECVTSSGDFWALIHDVFDDTDPNGTGFGHNRDTLLDAFRSGMLYSLRVEETQGMHDNGAGVDQLFATTGYLLPCLCIPEAGNRIVEIIWVHPRARRMGLASTLVRLMGLTGVGTIMPDSLPFWKAIGFTDALAQPELPVDVVTIANGECQDADESGRWWFAVRAPFSEWTTAGMGRALQRMQTTFGDDVVFLPEPITEGGILMTPSPAHIGQDQPRCFRGSFSQWPWITDPKTVLHEWQESGGSVCLIRGADANSALPVVITFRCKCHELNRWTKRDTARILVAFNDTGFRFHDWNCTTREIHI